MNALSKLGQDRFAAVNDGLEGFVESLASRADNLCDEGGKMEITDVEAWRIIDALQFVRSLPMHLENDPILP